MEIVGRGFIAKNLEPIAADHPHAVVLAAGVSRTTATSRAEFARERRLVEEAARRCRDQGRLLVFLSTASSGMYGIDSRGREDEPVRPRSPYAGHKVDLERLLPETGAEYLVLRLSHLVGPHQRSWQLLPSLVSQVRSGRVRIRPGAQRDLLEVGDMVRITDALLRSGTSKQIVNVASGISVPIERVVEHIEYRLGISALRDETDAERSSPIDIGKLRTLVPEVAAMGFGTSYYREVLDSYLGAAAWGAATRAR